MILHHYLVIATLIIVAVVVLQKRGSLNFYSLRTYEVYLCKSLNFYFLVVAQNSWKRVNGLTTCHRKLAGNSDWWTWLLRIWKQRCGARWWLVIFGSYVHWLYSFWLNKSRLLSFTHTSVIVSRNCLCEKLLVLNVFFKLLFEGGIFVWNWWVLFNASLCTSIKRSRHLGQWKSSRESSNGYLRKITLWHVVLHSRLFNDEVFSGREAAVRVVGIKSKVDCFSELLLTYRILHDLSILHQLNTLEQVSLSVRTWIL